MKRQKSAWSGILGLIRPQLGAIIALNVLAMLQAVFQVGLAIVTKLVVDAALYNGPFLKWAVVLGTLLLTVVLTHAMSSWLTGSTSDKCVARMRVALLDAANHCSKERLQVYHSGQLLSRGMEDVHTLSDGFVVTLPNILGQLTRLVGAFAAVILMYPALAPILILASLVIVGATALLRPVMRKQHRKVREADEAVMAGMQENLQQIELIQGLQMEMTTLDRFRQRVRRALKIRRKRRIWSVSISSCMSLVSQIGTGAVLLWGSLQVAGGAMSYGSLTAMLQLLGLLRNPVVGLSGMWTRLAAVEVAAARLKELLDQREQCVPQTESFGHINAVEFVNVTFSYPGEESPVLQNFSVRFPLEQWACLTGLSGKGKSTIFKLILGIYEPQQGQVLLCTDDGQIPCGQGTRHLFAYVPQDYSLFTGSVLENLLLAAPQAQPQQRKAALQVAQAGFVLDMANGEQTQVLENNSGLSKGQLQRLAIARAVLMDRQVLLLDECTSALDAQTEAAVLYGLQKQGKQAILVTHRPEMLQQLANIQFVDMEE